MFERIVTALETAVLGLWAGAMAGFAFVFAPIAIHWVTRMDVFASLIAQTIGGIGSLGTVLGSIAIVAALARLAIAARSTPRGTRRLALLRIALVVVALGGSAYETSVVIPRMTATAARIPGPIDSVPKTDPRRAAYDGEHAVSSRVYGVAFLCVVGALALAPFGRRRTGTAARPSARCRQTVV